MTDINKRFERAMRKERRTALASNIQRSWIVFGSLVAIFALLIYLNASPRHVTDVVHGATVSAHQNQRKDGHGRWFVTVRLETGEVVATALPPWVDYRASTEVELEVVRRDWPPRTSSYRFVRYTAQQ